MTENSNIGEARRFAAQITSELEFSEERAGTVAIIINELATNLVRHADKGRILLQATDANGVRAIQILSIDSGPGMVDFERSMQDGVTTSTTPGTGLGAIRRLSDEFDAESTREGTIICSTVRADVNQHYVPKPCFAVASICVPVGIETVSGDSWYQIRNGDNIVMMVVDGLGHGPLAHKVAATAVHAFREMDSSLPLDVMMQRLHALLRSTRGAALSLARWDSTSGQIEHLGIGNVRTVIVDGVKDRTLLNHPGTVGLQFKSKPPLSNPWNGRGHVIMHSDGIQSRWGVDHLAGTMDKHPAIVAGRIFRDFCRGNDDATILVGGFIS